VKRQAIDPPTTIPQPTTLETPTREITFLGCKVQKAPKADDSKPQNAPVETKSRDSKFPLVTTKETPLIARKRQKNSLGTGFRCLQIAKYPEKNIEALLRTHIQKIRNSHFIFAGSERHMMQEMFLSAARPFYHSADMLELTAIAPDIYIPFIVGHFLKRNRQIEVADVERVYTLFKGHTFYIQKTFNEAFADTPEGEICTLEMIRAAINNMIAANDTIFREILSNIPEKQKELLYAIAKDGEAERITSGSFIKRHSLTSASSVQSAVKKLLEKDIITEINKVFSVTDKLFSMWINQIYGNKSIFL